MEELTKIYTGMENGPEAIDENFNKLNEGAVHNTGDETIAGKKSFTDDMSVSNLVVTGTISAVTDVPWTSGISLESGFSTLYSSTGYEIKNGWVFANINLIQSQAAFKANTSVKVGTIPNLKIPGDIADFTFALPGALSSIEAKMELRRDGSIWLTPFTDMAAQTGTAYNRFYGSFSSPIA